MPTHSFSIPFSTVKRVNAAFDALLIETGQAHEKKAQTTVRVKNNRLAFTIKGRDAKAIQASTYNYTQMAQYLKNLE